MTVVSYGGALLDDAKTYYIQPADLYIANSVACKDNPRGLVLSVVGGIGLPRGLCFKSSTWWKDKFGYWDEKHLGYKVVHGTGSRQGAFSLQLVGLYNGDSAKPNQPIYIEATGTFHDPAAIPMDDRPCKWSDCGQACVDNDRDYYDTGKTCHFPGSMGDEAITANCPTLCGAAWQDHTWCCPNPRSTHANSSLQLTLVRSDATYFSAMACGTVSAGQQAISLKCADDNDTSVGFWGVTAYADFNDPRTKMNRSYDNIGQAVYDLDVFSRLAPTKTPLKNTLQTASWPQDMNHATIYVNRSTKFRFVFSETIP